MRKTAGFAGAAAAALVLLGAGGASASSGPQPDWGGNNHHHRDAGRTFVAHLKPLNAGEHTVAEKTYTIPSTQGTAVVRVKGDDVSVTIKVRGVTAKTLHPQHIHAGEKCPNASDDKNRDGFVDVIEGLPKYGPILVSLDSELDSFAPSLDFPVADAKGRYRYHEHASKSHLQAELKEALKLGTRHVVIHGINPDARVNPLPASVASLPGLPAWATLPVACGELDRAHH